MTGTFTPRRWWRLKVLGVALHIAVLLTAPFEHHDILCHLKTPLHCTACASSPLSSQPSSLAVPDLTHLTDAGQAVLVVTPASSAVFVAESNGRSPPALA